MLNDLYAGHKSGGTVMRVSDSITRHPARCLLAAFIVAMMVAFGGGSRSWSAAALQDDATPEDTTPVADATGTPEDEPADTAPALATVDAGTPVAEVGTRSPYAQTIAQGLVFIEGDSLVWRVRQVAPAPEEEAESVTGPSSFNLQISGDSVIRNDVTLKRARLEVGEAFYRSADDPYTLRSEGDDPSRVWFIELVPADAEAPEDGEAIFTSDPLGLDALGEGTYDMELIRNVLLPGEEADLPTRTGPALVMVTFGAIETSGGTEPAGTLDRGTGQVAEGDLTLSNTGTEPAVYVVAALGARVLDPGEDPDTATDAETTQAADDATPGADDTAAADDPDADTDGDGLANADETDLGTDPTDPDSDADGLTDGDEVNEFVTDPLNPDGDGDGLADGDEVNLYFTGVGNPDSDADGFTDGEEVLNAGSDPNDPDSFP